MTKEELKTKYARVPTDFSEIEMLKDQLLDSGLLEAAQVSPEDAGKVLGVKEDGTIGVVESGGSETQYQQIDISHTDAASTIAELVTITTTPFAGFVELKYTTYKYGSYITSSHKGYLIVRSVGGEWYSLKFQSVTIYDEVEQYGSINILPIYLETADVTLLSSDPVSNMMNDNLTAFTIDATVKNKLVPENMYSLTGGYQYEFVVKEDLSNNNAKEYVWQQKVFSVYKADNGNSLLTSVIDNTTNSGGEKRPFLLDYDWHGSKAQILITHCRVESDHFEVKGIDLFSLKAITSYVNVAFTKTVSEFVNDFKTAAISIEYPSLPNDASSKTYVLKAVNGVLTWVEETA